MKKSLLVIFTFFGIALNAQQPTIGATTIIPQSPVAGSNIKIVTKITTPYQGVHVDKSFNVTQNPMEISLRLCYGTTMLTALGTYVDTFEVGQLPIGNYTIKLKAYMSSTNQHCTKIDSNMVVSTLTVSSGVATGLSEINHAGFSVYPNPAKDKLYFENTENYTQALIFQLEGWLVDAVVIGRRGELNVAALSKGLYFVRFSNTDRSKTIKFIKE